jgi:hypothetical protein
LKLFVRVIPLAMAGCCLAATKADWPALRKQIEETLHVPQPLPALQEKSYGRFLPVADVRAERVSYSTDYGLRVPAIVYREAGPTITAHPAIIIVNGHGDDKSSWYSYWAGILYARAGAVVLTYDPIGATRTGFRRPHSTMNSFRRTRWRGVFPA